MATKQVVQSICRSTLRYGRNRNVLSPAPALALALSSRQLSSSSCSSFMDRRSLLQQLTLTPQVQHCNRTRTFSNRVTAISNNVKVNGVNIHYEQAGTGDHVLILLPGALGSSQTDFKPQIEGLDKDKYTIIAFDPRGYGKSRPPDRDWPLLFLHRDAEDAAELMKILGFHHYSILGWSDGGITGLILAATFPKNVRKLVTWGSNSYVGEKDIAMYDIVGDIDAWSERMRAPFINLYGEEYFRAQWEHWLNAIKAIYDQRKGNICNDILGDIKCKTLIINGHKDALVPQEHPLNLQKNIPNCRTIDWPEGKHNLHLKYHKEFNEVVEEFLDEAD